MNELEVKVFNVDIITVKESIINNGGKLVKRENQSNYYYNLPSGSGTGYIRIRTVENLIDKSTRYILCIKKIISEDKCRLSDEHEFEIKDFNECRNFLKALGLEFHSKQDKYRESYEYMGALIEFDIWDKRVFPDPYMEIEAENEKKIYSVLTALDIPEYKATSKSLTEVKKEMGL